MAFSISDFKSQGLVYGGARPALFSISIGQPQGLSLDNTTLQKLEFVARAANIPESNIEAIQVPYFGRKIKVAGDRTFADWRITVMNDEDYSVRAMLEKWSNALNSHVRNLRQLNLDFENYKSSMNVVQYGKDGLPIREYELVGAFPTSIDAMDLDWDNANQIQTFNATFAYDYWVPVIENNDKSIGDNSYLNQV